MPRRARSLVLFLVLLVSGCSASNQTTPQGTVPVVSVPTVLILDASGSMTENDAPGPRIDAAKAAAHQLIDALPDDSTIGLTTYGTNTGSADGDKALGCQDVTVTLPLGPLDRPRMAAAINTITPSGYTPISLALQTAADQLPADDSDQAIVLVSDGEDKCDIPPCETAAQLKQQRPGLTISTVGFRIDGQAIEQLRCIADTTGGLFVQAANADQLTTRLLATQNINQANQSLSATGIFGVSLGETIERIRAKHPDFPTVDSTATVTVIWRECDFGFTDGALDSIAPHDGGRTIDGVTRGTELRRVTELYGDPVAVDPNAATVVYSAESDNAESKAGYRIKVDNLVENGGRINGQVTTIVLCRCLPDGAGRWTDPVVVVTPNSVGAVKLGMSNEQIEAVADVKLRTDNHGAFTELPPAYAFYESSTINRTAPHPSYREISISLPAGQQLPEQVVMTAEGFRLGESVDDLHRIYGDRLRPYEALGMNSVRGYLLAGEGGHLIFNTIDRNGVEVHQFVVTQADIG